MAKRELYPRYLFRKKMALQLLEEYFPRTDNFLEIGAGSGDFAKTLAEHIGKGDIIEFSDEAVTLLQQEFSHDNVTILHGDFLAYPFENKYALIVLFEVLEHIRDDIAFVHKLHQSLKDGGIVILSVPSKMKNWDITDEIAGHCRRYEKKDLIKIFQDHHFKIIHFSSYGFPWLRVTSFLRNLLFKMNSKKLRTHSDKETRTRKSGLEYLSYFRLKKIAIFFVRMLFCDPLLSFYIYMSRPFDKHDMGDGYICLLKK